MRKKIVIALPGFGYGGAEKMVSDLALGLDRDKYEITVLCMYDKKNPIRMEEKILDAGIEIIYIGKPLGISFRAMFSVYKVLNKIKPDIIHSNLGACIYCIPWIMLHKCKLIHTIHNRPQYDGNRLIFKAMKLMYGIGKAIPIGISKSIAKEISEFYNVEFNTIPIVYNAVDLTDYELKNSEKKSVDRIKIINVARMTEVKNQKALIDAFCILESKYKNVYLELVGDGEKRVELEEYVKEKELQGRIEFLGNIEDVPKHLMNADIFALTSHYEGLPLTLLEAMAAKLPIVTTNVGGTGDVISHGVNGFLYEDDDQSKLIEFLECLILDEKLRKQMGFAGLEFVKQFDSKIMAEKYATVYEKQIRDGKNYIF